MSGGADGPDDGWQTVTNPQEAAAAAKAGAASGPVRLQGTDLLTTMEPGLAAQVKAIGSYDMPLPPSSRGNGAAIQQAVAQVYPNYDYVNAPTKLAARKAFLVGKQGQNITVLNTVLGHVGECARAVDDLGNTNFPALNSIENSVLPAAGDASLAAKLRRVQLARQAVSDDLASAFKGGGAGDVHNEKAFGATFNSNDSLLAARQSVQTAGTLLYSRIKAQAESYQRAMGTAGDPFTLLGPHAREALDQVTGDDYLKNGVGALTAPLFAKSGGPDDPSAGGGASAQPTPGGGGGSPSTPPAGGTIASPPAAGTQPMPSAPAPAAAVTLSADGSSDMVDSKEKEVTAAAQALLNYPKSTRADFDALSARYGRQPFDASLDKAIAARNAGSRVATIIPAVTHTGPSIPGAIANSGVGSAVVGATTQGSFGLLPKAVAGVNAVKDKLLGDDTRSFGDIYANDLSDAHAVIDASRNAHPLAALGETWQTL